jgi:hypothetical protein
MTSVVVGAVGVTYAWRGRVRLTDGTVLFTCEHVHHNQQQSRFCALSAFDCARRWASDNGYGTTLGHPGRSRVCESSGDTATGDL